jgi:hypothetical protein
MKNGPKMDRKKRVFFFRKTPDHACFQNSENTKKVLMLVFFGPFTRFFSLLKMKKNQKKWKSIRKITFFPVFPYALRPFFQNIRITQNANV